MAIAVVNTASAQLVDSTTIDVDIAVSGSDKYLLVFVGFNDPSTTFEVSAATYNLASMGAAIQSEVDFNGFVNHLCYAVANPADGTNNVAITINGICDEVGLTVIALSGVDQATPYGTIVAEAATTYTTMDIDVASATDELVVDSLWFVRNSNSSGAFLTVGANQTSQEEQEDIGTWACMGLSTEPGATTTTMSWTPVDTTTFGYSYFGIPIKPAAGGGVTGSGSITSQNATISGSGSVTTAVPQITVTLSGGENLTGLSYTVFNGYNIGTSTILKQGVGETTDAGGNLAIDLTGTGAQENDPVTVVVTDYTTSPSPTNECAVSYGTVTVN